IISTLFWKRFRQPVGNPPANRKLSAQARTPGNVSSMFATLMEPPSNSCSRPNKRVGPPHPRIQADLSMEGCAPSRPAFPANIWDDTEVVPPGLADAI